MIGSGWLVTQIVPLRLEGRRGGLSGSHCPPRLGGKKKSLPVAQDSRGSHLFNEAVVLDNGAKVRDPVSTEHFNKVPPPTVRPLVVEPRPFPYGLSCLQLNVCDLEPGEPLNSGPLHAQTFCTESSPAPYPLPSNIEIAES